MENMKLYKLFNLIILTIILLSSTSCDDWLTVLPETKVHSDKLLSDQKGYQDAVIGLYLKLGSKELYGQELTMKTPDGLAQYYAYSIEDELFDLVNYDFERTSTDNTITSIWSSSYNLIANCNNILTQLEDVDDDVFDGNMKDVLTYQVLTIRSLAHFDLFRLFHAPYVANKDFLGIPYVKGLSLELTEQSTSEQVVSLVLDDLKKAYELSKATDPILPDNPQQDFEYMKEKTLYINHYAITGLLARVYMYINNNEQALKYAKEILDEDRFNLTHAQDVLPEKDFAFFDEVLFGVHVSKIDEYTRLDLFKTDTEIMK